MTLDEFLDAVAASGIRFRMAEETGWIRAVDPAGRRAVLWCDCPIEALARHRHRESLLAHGPVATGLDLGLDKADIETIIAAADGHLSVYRWPALLRVRARLEALCQGPA